ncbi:rod shape-determining protein RodA [Thermobrachium celere]|uniref:Rod shape-determining protein RodA n=1 Tax=Thermobrachium celere DSM 8682 TaxID=941824 RepID=R7RQ00_9CLOT|nr:rod shape-determining protein RodA [Thermobrachium celere]CDF58119.1 Rod shape-determining protein RodA [Thermobrachium celere DSM 8682]
MITINKKLFRYFDLNIFISMIIICFLGISTIFFANNALETGNYRNTVAQIIILIVSLIVFCFVILIDYTTIGSYYKFIYVATNLLIVAVLLFGKEVNGAKAWLGVGPFGIQPSEFAKLSIIIGLAKILEEVDEVNKFDVLKRIFIYVIIPMALIQLQPDLGTNMIIAVIVLGILFVAGLDLKFIYIPASIMAVFIPIAWKLDLIAKHQKHRILVFLNPELDKLGIGYNAAMAKLAIASGKFFPKNSLADIFRSNTELSSGKFIPEAHTDFIFAVFAENWGFLGSIILLLLYFNILYRAIKISKVAKDKFGQYLVVGIVTMIGFQVFQNIGMDIGLMPITGIPLPFMSYGGTSLLTNVIAIGLIINVSMRRKKINF